MNRHHAAYRAWSFWMLATVLILLGILEVWYRTYPYHRHPVDYKITLLEQLSGKNYEQILLSDSVTATPLRGIALSNNVLDMTTNQAISLAGNYFILKRYLQRNKPPREVYLFFIPDLLKNNLDNKLTYSYFETIFNRPDEVQLMKALGRNDLYQNSGDFFEKRFESINFFKHYHFEPVKLPPRETVVAAIQSDADQSTTQRNQSRILNKEIVAASPISNEFLPKFLELCQQQQIKATLVLEPLPSILYEKWFNSELKVHTQKISTQYSARYIDTNLLYNFPDNAYSDGIHLKKKWANFYVHLINERITPILAVSNTVN